MSKDADVDVSRLHLAPPATETRAKAAALSAEEHTDLEDIYGRGPPGDKQPPWTDLELLALIDRDWLSKKEANIPFITSKGVFSIKRSINNPRGDDSSVQPKVDSISKVGLSTDNCVGAPLVEHPDIERDEEFEALGVATRCEGVERCWLADTKKKNVAVQLTLKAGLKKGESISP